MFDGKKNVVGKVQLFQGLTESQASLDYCHFIVFLKEQYILFNEHYVFNSFLKERVFPAISKEHYMFHIMLLGNRAHISRCNF